uniref:uncharacterized protein LOC105349456 n=1 Tax=Fragaria vesca subsp. vesca TaxID=101020 RepID=UPI0005C9C60E|nr:PREDICTED: uncharacterized protein LOC105349456 [Fragaria vesca subsp. vesca]XP_011457455.1 PREDICTED: uncharacterized protein LOC105349456 [Fragaria vesca subsp. vesca]XP_011457456.1 PREDICTED: uncharacterized protein LOC105349456 [Fragaria vesca subsp. vesca]XP_011457457.1 PREDICTED: uncharacterized protein LOC105349456 [Fragaria vesca subsp. vesca]XP_011457458.1 PREDICTED: uncharacterized protein LOC105349456 [Fragaria vesca subsp. vesca]
MRGRKRSCPGVAPAREARRVRRGEKEIDYEMIHHMEAEAYHAVLKAFSAQSDSLSWDRVAMMTKLRKELNITDDEHAELLVQIRRSDESVRALREWRNSNGTAIQEFGNVDKRSGFIQIRATNEIIHEVEKLLDCQEILSPAQLEAAKLVLQEHERDILEVLDQLAIDEAAGA